MQKNRYLYQLIQNFAYSTETRASSGTTNVMPMRIVNEIISNNAQKNDEFSIKIFNLIHLKHENNMDKLTTKSSSLSNNENKLNATDSSSNSNLPNKNSSDKKASLEQLLNIKSILVDFVNTFLVKKNA